MRKNKITVTIGIAAYNEEKNIGKLLAVLKNQQEEFIRIEEILIYSDGSTDNTVTEVNKISDSRIRIIVDPQRRGKAYRLNQLFRQAEGEVIVLFDADYIPTTKDTVERICSPFRDRTFRGLSSGRRKAIPSRSLTAVGMANVYQSYDIVRSKLHDGKNLYSFLAGVTALHRDFARSLKLPLDSPCDDNHIYLEAKRRNLPLSYVPRAIVWFSPPQSAKDQIAQGSRYLASSDILSRYFDAGFVKGEFYVPNSLRIRVFLYQVLRNPIAYVWVKCLSIICNIWNRKFGRTQGGTWNMIHTTKLLK